MSLVPGLAFFQHLILPDLPCLGVIMLKVSLFFPPKKLWRVYPTKFSLFLKVLLGKKEEMNKQKYQKLQLVRELVKTAKQQKTISTLCTNYFLSQGNRQIKCEGAINTPKGPLLSKCAQSSACRTAAETRGPTALHGFCFICREGHVSMLLARDLKLESLAKFGKRGALSELKAFLLFGTFPTVGQTWQSSPQVEQIILSSQSVNATQTIYKIFTERSTISIQRTFL